MYDGKTDPKEGSTQTRYVDYDDEEKPIRTWDEKTIKAWMAQRYTRNQSGLWLF